MVEGSVDLSPDASFAGYRIVRRLGRGGMGIVYEAIEVALDRRVALKLIVPDLASDDDFRERFDREVHVAAAIEHPNVVPVYAVGEHDGVPYLAMRFVSGSDLGRLIRSRGSLEAVHATTLVAQAGAGLDAIHAAGLIHRDVKPGNFLLTRKEGEEHVYLTDFGIAKNVAETRGLTKTGRVVGTVDYLAPEQIRATGVDARSDVYALGCVLFKALTGKAVFPAEDVPAKLRAHLEQPPPAPSQVEPEVPPALDAVIARALAKDPDERYPSAGDLGRAAFSAAAGEETTRLDERSVAVGAAAPGLTAAETDLMPPTAADVAPEPVAQRPASRRGGLRDARIKPLAPLLAVGTIVLLVLALIAGGSGGGDSGSNSPKSGGDAGPTTVDKTTTAPTTPTPAALSEAELIGQADAICVDSRARYIAIESPPIYTAADAERQADQLSQVAYGSYLDLDALEPPASLATDYGAYVAARKRMYDYLVVARDAAAAGDLDGFDAAKALIDAESDDRYGIARSVGFNNCSPKP